MFRKLLLLLAAAAAAAVAWFVWKERDELRGEIERTRGEWRSGAAGKPRARVPAPGVSGPQPAEASAAVDADAEPPAAGSREARVTPRDEHSAPTSEAAGQAVGRCIATTQSGARCTRPAEPGASHCWQHGG
jgi:HAMP domain-containing protein